MSAPDGVNPEEPEHPGNGEENPKPSRWTVTAWRFIKRLIGAVHHAHAPHWVIALFTFLLVVFAWRAWDESVSGTNELRRQADNAQKQLKALRDEQRPWVGMGYAGYAPDTPFQLQFKNAGKSPAFDVAIFAKVIPGAISDPPQLPGSRCTIDCKIDGLMLLPDVPYQFILLKEQISNNPIAFRDVPAWIIGRADYKDADGLLHKTGICLYHRPETHDLISCPIANSNYAD